MPQPGFVRLSFNPAFSSDAVSPPEALILLPAITAMDGHEFWPNDIDCVSASFADDLRSTGQRQVSDAYPLSFARERSGCLATLDCQISWLLPRSDRPGPHLRIVESR
ncbi:MAG: hypothetical protein OXI66_09445 [Boseongicola sp.]|nr:hypothetical protein [Boseongicola sp.]MXW84676.1 hypothetical protein [Boseongicola sp. SB0667_bin_21]MYI70364.1 hypothetical protein [Boseongicola sp. SB0673_bin_14]